jgi:2-polyprenyl-3-methyl-5-hydroxy-6-metoxy-1,4-benzoquinol methylase
MNESPFAGNASTEFARRTYAGVYVDYSAEQFSLGPINSYNLLRDAKHLVFILSRYKFVAKMLHQQESVLEIGCQEGLGSLLVAQSVKRLTATDFYKPHIENCLGRLAGRASNVRFLAHDIIGAPITDRFTAAFALDVLEHIDPAQTDVFMRNIIQSLAEHAVLILGTPSLESQVYASKGSQAGHINCLSGEALRSLCQRFFHQVFMFGMNDEVVHTGFLPMAHYVLALCCEPRR